MKKTTLLLVFIAGLCNAWAQHTVTGKVADQDSEELIGVNISVKNITGLGAVSNLMGIIPLSFRWVVMIYYFNTLDLKIS